MRTIMGIEGLTVQIEKPGIRIVSHFFKDCTMELAQTESGDWKMFVIGDRETIGKTENCATVSLNESQLRTLRGLINKCLGDER